MKLWTQNLTAGSLVISAADNANYISIVTEAAGTCTVTGGMSFKGLASQAVTLTAGEGLNWSAFNTAFPLDGITITWVAGTTKIVTGF